MTAETFNLFVDFTKLCSGWVELIINKVPQFEKIVLNPLFPFHGYNIFICEFFAAPEVLKSKGYNRSLDMWSVGVIIYVR